MGEELFHRIHEGPFAECPHAMRYTGIPSVRKCYLSSPASSSRMTTTVHYGERCNRLSGIGEGSREGAADQFADAGGFHAVS